MIEAIVLWFFAGVACIACALQIYGIRMARYLERVLEAQLTGMNEQYLLGYQALTESLARVEKRIKALEDEVL